MADQSAVQYSEIVPGKVRWLAIAAGCVSGASGSLLSSPLFLLIPSILILGAILQPYSPRKGRWLMWVGTFFLSLYVGGFLAPLAIEVVRTPRSAYDGMIAGLRLLSMASLLLVSWCVVALVIDANRLRRTSTVVEGGPQRVSDWFVCVVAVCLSVLVLVGCPSPKLHPRLKIAGASVCPWGQRTSQLVRGFRKRVILPALHHAPDLNAGRRSHENRFSGNLTLELSSSVVAMVQAAQPNLRNHGTAVS